MVILKKLNPKPNRVATLQVSDKNAIRIASSHAPAAGRNTWGTKTTISEQTLEPPSYHMERSKWPKTAVVLAERAVWVAIPFFRGHIGVPQVGSLSAL